MSTKTSKLTSDKVVQKLHMDLEDMMVATAHISGDHQVGIPDTEVHLVFGRQLMKDMPEIREELRKDFRDLTAQLMDEPHIRVLYDDECGGCGRRMIDTDGKGHLICRHCKEEDHGP